jgi:choline dehydrogenase-like flavoprotein
MFIDARGIEDNHTVEADICIAGAGAAGITLALALRDAGLNVVLLESGGFARDPQTDQLSAGQMTGIASWRPQQMRARVFGGTTSLWQGWCRPLLAQDFESRDYVANSGWPIRYPDLVPWYVRACQTVHIGAFIWDAEGRATAARKPLLPSTGVLDQRYYQFSRPTHLGNVYRDALDGAGDVRVMLRANVTDIRLDSRGSRVVSYACRTLGGMSFEVRARKYVLALGGLENARVLLASRSQQTRGVANAHDVVGRYFMEHPHYYRSLAIVHPEKLDLTFFQLVTSDLKRPDGSAVSIMGALGLKAEAAQREGLLSFTATIHSETAPSKTGALGPTAAQCLVTRGREAARTARLTVRAEQSPRADSRVVLTEERDALGMPRLAVDWRIAAEDDVQMKRGLMLLARELAAAGVARAWVPGDSSRFIWQQSPGGHHMGTTRMGTDRKTSVVDANCRAHDVENLYLAGSSVFPTGGDSNPTLTIVALAHRLAETLKDAA